MPTNHLIGFAGFSQFSMNHRIAIEHPREIHHLAQPNDLLPFHRLADFHRSNARTGRFHAGRRGNTGGHLHIDVNGLVGSLIRHQADTFQSKDVGDFVWIDEHPGRPTRRDSTHKLGYGQHARFDVHVSIQQSRTRIAPASIDNLRTRTNGMTCIRTNKCNPFAQNGNIRVWDNLTRLDTHPPTVANNHIGGNAPHGTVHQFSGVLSG